MTLVLNNNKQKETKLAVINSNDNDSNFSMTMLFFAPNLQLKIIQPFLSVDCD